jgi:type II secretory pathway pseudopilin PulG
MITWTGSTRRAAGRGFTLIEVLLATVLLMLLLGAIVFNFAGLEQGARLDEGAAQFEAMLRFARAQATSSGRQVRVVFDEAADPDFPGGFEKVRLTWEPDPLGKPGTFEELPENSTYLVHVNDLVQVESIRLTGPGSGPSDAEAATPEAVDAPPGNEPMGVTPIRFYPDGSSDSAEIVLLSRNDQDQRRVTLRLIGITGVVRRSVAQTDATGATNGPETAPSPPASKTQAAGSAPGTQAAPGGKTDLPKPAESRQETAKPL